MKRYTALFGFCGLGGGALGFQRARAHLLGEDAQIESLGGIDNDPASCRDFERLTGSPALCVDVWRLTPPVLRAFVGQRAPDVVFGSAPCKGFSSLLSKKRAAEPKYQQLNRLAVQWTQLMLGTWAKSPRLILFENVPRITSRGKDLLAEIRGLLEAAGYALHEGTHDCGELGGLAQRRRRYLLVARHRETVPPLLHRPPLKPVRGVGEVLGALPMPGDPAGGAMHKLPKISWLNWVRLALIPAGGDWRDLPGTLEDGQPRREVHRRHHVQRWTDAASTVAGSGSNGPSAVADPRVPAMHTNCYRVRSWDEPSGAVTSAGRPANGGGVVADPRVRFGHADSVVAWDAPAGTVTTSPAPSSGAVAAADPRVKTAYDHGYAVLRWDETSPTIAAGSHPGQGAYSVADIRPGQWRAGSYGVLSWEEAAGTITGRSSVTTGRFSIADPRTGEVLSRIENIRRAPKPGPPLIIASDGTWHRPLTTLELAALQSFPATIDGEPLVLDGTSSSAWRERIGNAVPPDAAEAIAEQMLLTLLCADGAGFRLSSQAVWVAPEVTS